MNSVYFPRQKSFTYLNIENYMIFDASNIEEWEWFLFYSKIQ